MERYNRISPKLNYYTGVIIACFSLAILAVAIDFSVKSSDYVLITIIMLLVIPAILNFNYLVAKNIYASIDNMNNRLCYGNLLFYQEIKLNELRITRWRPWWIFFNRVNSYYKISIGDKTYVITTRMADLEGQIKAVDSGSG